MKFLDYLKWELHPFRLSLYHKNWQSFSFTPWLPYFWKFQCVYLIYRWIFALFFFAWIFPIGLAPENGEAKYFIFLTNWAYMVWVIYLIWGAFSSTATFLYFHFLCKSKFSNKFSETRDGGRFAGDLLLDDKPTGCCGSDNDQTFWHQKVQWVLFNVGVVVAVSVVILFWLLVYDPQTTDYDVAGGVNLMTHLFNGLGAIIDVLVSGIPLRLLHLVYPLAFTGAYAVFTGVYHGFNGTNVNNDPFIYPVINYNASPGLAAFVVLSLTLLFIPFMHLVIYCIFLVREGLIYLVRTYCCKRVFEDDNENDLGTFASDNAI